ncbi:MAG: DUF411 domain-containing protein [Pseudomonadales bacterium]|nr:DUF411 domain-containing protein [Pseudomonadales bacterium]
MKKAIIGTIAGLGLAGALAIGWSLQADDKAAAEADMKVFKTETCGCCGDWVDHMERVGFDIEAIDVTDLNAVKHEYGIHPQLQSCHTGVMDGYIFEGHIPGKVIQAFLDNPPAGAKGLAAPGMPMGSPGMEMGKFVPYNVLLVKNDGSTSIFQRITSPDYE